jgi:hypothetical protein
VGQFGRALGSMEDTGAESDETVKRGIPLFGYTVVSAAAQRFAFVVG